MYQIFIRACVVGLPDTPLITDSVCRYLLVTCLVAEQQKTVNKLIKDMSCHDNQTTALFRVSLFGGRIRKHSRFLFSPFLALRCCCWWWCRGVYSCRCQSIGLCCIMIMVCDGELSDNEGERKMAPSVCVTLGKHHSTCTQQQSIASEKWQYTNPAPLFINYDWRQAGQLLS